MHVRELIVDYYTIDIVIIDEFGSQPIPHTCSTNHTKHPPHDPTPSKSFPLPIPTGWVCWDFLAKYLWLPWTQISNASASIWRGLHSALDNLVTAHSPPDPDSSPDSLQKPLSAHSSASVLWVLKPRVSRLWILLFATHAHMEVVGSPQLHTYDWPGMRLLDYEYI